MDSTNSPENKLNIQGKLGLWELRPTEDGSQTLYSHHFDETCHSVYGAREETQHVYVEGCELLQLTASLPPNASLRVLEVGLGSGLGLEVTKDWLVNNSPSTKLQYVAFELDAGLAAWSLERVLGSAALSRLQKTIWPEISAEHWIVPTSFGEVQVLIGDARKTVLKLKELQQAQSLAPFHAIYQDPFSPKKNPTLWTLEWFQALTQVCGEETRLATYSASVRALKAMIDAGWFVERFPGYKFKKVSSRAVRCERTGAINSELNGQRNLTPLRDCELSCTS
jgi:tRNA U34 5-methylaminomethyl-2-thiouridine-forming methyltransferase MnmC